MSGENILYEDSVGNTWDINTINFTGSGNKAEAIAKAKVIMDVITEQKERAARSKERTDNPGLKWTEFDAGLPADPGWEVRVSTTGGTPFLYYYNKQTQETRNKQVSADPDLAIINNSLDGGWTANKKNGIIYFQQGTAKGQYVDGQTFTINMIQFKTGQKGDAAKATAVTLVKEGNKKRQAMAAAALATVVQAQQQGVKAARDQRDANCQGINTLRVALTNKGLTGWDVECNSNGGVFFVNTHLKTVMWHTPVGPAPTTRAEENAMFEEIKNKFPNVKIFKIDY